MALIRYFKMDDNAANTTVYDSTGTANGTASQNTVDMSAMGMLGRSLSFNGTTDEVDTGSDYLGVTDLTVCAWIYPTGWGENNAGRIIDNSKFIWLVTTTNDTVVVSVGGTGAKPAATDAIVLSTWTFACVTATSASPSIVNHFVNGIASGTANQEAGNPAAGGNVIIGNNGGGTRAFAGRIDNVRVYNEILTAQQIYNQYIADTTNSVTNPIVINSFGVDTVISSGPVTVTSIVVNSPTAGHTATFIDKSNVEVLRLATNYGDGSNNGSMVWTPPRGEPFTFNGLKFDDSASSLADGDYVFVYLA